MKKNQLRSAVTGGVGAALIGLSAVTGVTAANATPLPTDTSTAAPAPTDTAAPAPTSTATTAPDPTATDAPAPVETTVPVPTETAAPAPEAPTAAPVVDPVLTFGSASGKPGDLVPFSGTGFVPGSTVYVIFDNNIEAATVTADDNGAFSGSFTVPNVDGGAHVVKASAVNVISPIATFNVIVPPKPGTTLSTTTAAPGTTFTISGSNFTPGTVLTIVFHSTPTVLGTTTVQPDGSFSFTGSVPAGAPAGGHQVQAVAPDGTVLTSIPFTVAAATGPKTTSTPTGTGTTTSGTTTTGTNGTTAGTGSITLGSGAATAQGQTAGSAAAGVGSAATTGDTAKAAAARGMKVQTAAMAPAAADPQFGWSLLSGVSGAALLALGFLGFRRTRES